MAPIRLSGVPRRSRVLLVVFAFFCVLLLLPTSRGHLGRALLFALFSPHSSPSSPPFPSYGAPHRAASDVLRFVDPLIGTVNGGHVFPGATLPYGMAKAVADTNSHAENAAGFVSDESEILGFSHMHDSGTGGNPSLGNFPLFVHPGCPHDDFAQCEYSGRRRAVARVNGSVKASPGYFAIGLNNSVYAEMTATAHATLYRFSFPGGEAAVKAKAAGGNGTLWSAEDPVPYSPLVLVDLADLAVTRSAGGVQIYPETGRVIGDGVFGPSFGLGHYSAYFCADFRGAGMRRTGTFMGTTATEDPKFLNGVGSGFRIPSGSAGAWIHFDPPPDHRIMARVGLSFLSTDRACANAEAEIPDWGFESTVAAAEDAWREKLSAVEVDATGVSEELQTTFWSGLYRTMLSPQNYTGENQKWTSDEPYYDSFYCIWDSFRAQHPLLTIIDPPAQTEMVRALIDIYRFEGKLPDCRMSFCKGYTQGGSNADVVIADAFVKNLTAGIDWATAYEAVVSDAEEEPTAWGSEGRGNLVSYHRFGYIPWNDVDYNGTGPSSRSISRQVEYAYDDFCISLLAEGLGRAADAEKYRRRGANWRKLWNPDQRDLYRDTEGEVVSSPFVGFLQPRLVNGTWRYHNTRRCSPVYDMHACYYDTGYDTYEGSPWLYSFFAPQDMASLVSLMGGPATFADRLSYFHESGIAYMGNEQTFLPVFQFHYAARPGLSSRWAHAYIPSLFNASVNGIPGNDDCAMGAFSAFAIMGFFPVAGQDVYLLTPPFFPEVRLRATADPRKRAVIRVLNFDPTYEAKYIQSATLDGVPYTRSWITHGFFLHGGVLEFKVGREESETWGTRDEDLPPSYYGGGGEGGGSSGSGSVSTSEDGNGDGDEASKELG